jgi:predicted SprT family Zn-dependent metalloprotease
MSRPDPELPSSIRKRLDRWLVRWQTPSLRDTLRIEFSPRLRRAFGRCYQEERLIRLTPSLLDTQSALLAEILCHEAAHAAVYELFGRAARPHGAEWEELMRQVGFEPRVRIPVVVRAGEATASDRIIYLHQCPSCEISRHASRPMHRWRCRTCVEDGSEGRLVILRQHPARQKHAAAQSVHPRRRAAASRSSVARPKKQRARQQRST